MWWKYKDRSNSTWLSTCGLSLYKKVGGYFKWKDLLEGVLSSFVQDSLGFTKLYMLGGFLAHSQLEIQKPQVALIPIHPKQQT